MLCSRFKQILFTKTTVKHNAQFRCFINAHFVSKLYGIDTFWTSLTKHRKELHKMSSVRFIWRDIGLNRLWSVWTRSAVIGRVVRRYRKDRGVREVVQYFRQTFLRPKCSLLLATVACQAKDNDEKPGKPLSCGRGIRDEELESLITDLEGADELSKKTLYCLKCGNRLVIEKKLPRIKYCLCKEPGVPSPSPDGWVPYMEAEDVIIWRKEYKKGQGLFAYKVYGRYKDIQAADYAAVNVDGAYRRLWDSAVAALSVVERNADGLEDQTVLHWEVLWPRLFANRDYVYIRRHKEFTVKHNQAPENKTPPDDAPMTPPGVTTTPPAVTTATPPASTTTLPPAGTTNLPAAGTPTTSPSGSNITPPASKPTSPPIGSITTPPAVTTTTPPGVTITSPPAVTPTAPAVTERPSVHDNAKKKSLEIYSKAIQPNDKTNKVYVIISRSCIHPEVPETRNAIRVLEYWSHMVVKTINGGDEIGMEFVLTYYDEPAVGGMPSGVTAWATGRAAPVYLQRMRRAAKEYESYKRGRSEDIPDFTPFRPETKKIQYEEGEHEAEVNEEDMESSKTGPEMDYTPTRSQGTQTDDQDNGSDGERNNGNGKKPTEDKSTGTKISYEEELPTRPSKDDCEKTSEISEESGNEQKGWWSYLYPFYYFV